MISHQDGSLSADMQTRIWWALSENLSCKELSERADEESTAVLFVQVVPTLGDEASLCWVCFRCTLIKLLFLGLCLCCGSV